MGRRIVTVKRVTDTSAEIHYHELIDAVQAAFLEAQRFHLQEGEKQDGADKMTVGDLLDHLHSCLPGEGASNA